VRHENTDAESLKAFYEKEPASATFENVQVFDFEALKGRMLSSSYMPDETSTVFPALVEELQALFAKHSENGRISVFYDTKIYYSQV
jgi:hypothetical protein